MHSPQIQRKKPKRRRRCLILIFFFLPFNSRFFGFLVGEDNSGAGEGGKVWIIFKEDQPT